jgi:predicted phage tail protein
MKNWKTTAAGLVLAAISFATYMDWINASQAGMISTILTALGFSLAKDSGVSGKEW